MNLDRDLQKQLLMLLGTVYPRSGRNIHLDFPDVDREVVTVNLYYLCEHGLIDAKWSETNSGIHSGAVKLTAKGVDFLADDGGLSAVLGVVTVKLHGDSVRALLAEHVEKSTADPSLKALLLKKIKSLPASALEAVTMEGLKTGMKHLPDAVGWLQKWLEH